MSVIVTAPTPVAPTAAAPTRYSSLAIAGFVLAFFTNIVGLVISIVALVRIGRSGAQGRGLAIAGIVVGGAWMAALAVGLMIRLIVVATGHAA